MNELQYAEDVPPDYTEGSSFDTTGAEIQIFIAPLPDSNSFQQFEYTASGSPDASFVAGEIQIKSSTSASSSRIATAEDVSITLEGMESTGSDTAAVAVATTLGCPPSPQNGSTTAERIFLSTTETIWPPNASQMSRKSTEVRSIDGQDEEAHIMPSLLRFKLRLPDDICSCLHLGTSRVEYHLVARYQRILVDYPNSTISTSCKQLVHIMQTNTPTNTAENHGRGILTHFSTPVKSSFYIPRSSFLQGSTLPIFFTLAIPVLVTSAQLRRVTAELVRYVTRENLTDAVKVDSIETGEFAQDLEGTQRLVLLRSGKSLRIPTSSGNGDQARALRILLRLPLPRSDELCESHTMISPMKWHRCKFFVRLGLETMTGQEMAVEKEINILPANPSAIRDTSEYSLLPHFDSRDRVYLFRPEDEYDGYSQGVPSSTATIWQEEANSLASEEPIRIHRQATELQQDIVLGQEDDALPDFPVGEVDQDRSHFANSSDSLAQEADSACIGGHLGENGTRPPSADGLSGPPPYPMLEQYNNSGFVTPYEHDESVQRVLTSAPPYREM